MAITITEQEAALVVQLCGFDDKLTDHFEHAGLGVDQRRLAVLSLSSRLKAALTAAAEAQSREAESAPPPSGGASASAGAL